MFPVRYELNVHTVHHLEEIQPVLLSKAASFLAVNYQVRTQSSKLHSLATRSAPLCIVLPCARNEPLVVPMQILAGRQPTAEAVKLGNVGTASQ
jgi:hypothetical protein